MDSATLYRIDLAYIGSRYHGWQSQKSRCSIQDHLEQALSTLLRHPVKVVGASRTDSGVHAEHQVAVFRSQVPFAPERWLRSLNGLLPEDVGVLSVAPTTEDFHPITSATGKAYRYRLWQGGSRHPQLHPYCWTLLRGLDISAMRAAALHLVGMHDFSSFCASDSSAKTRHRLLWEVEIFEDGPMIEVWIIGKGFLKQMVRIMVGTLVDIGLGKYHPDDLMDIIKQRDRTAAGGTAPANGLTLVEIFFAQIASAQELRQRAFKMPL